MQLQVYKPYLPRLLLQIGMFTNGRGITVVPGTGPPIIYSFIASPTSGEVPLTVAFACVAHDFGGTVDSYTLDYGDLSSLETNTTGLFSYEYVTVGAYDATDVRLLITMEKVTFLILWLSM